MRPDHFNIFMFGLPTYWVPVSLLKNSDSTHRQDKALFVKFLRIKNPDQN